jgi:hypothetical protein
VVWGLFRSRRVAEIEVVPDRPVYLPGDTVTARVRLTPAVNADRAECSVALVHRDRYGGGDSAGGDEWAVPGEYLLDEAPVRAGEVRQWAVALPVPWRTTPPATAADCADERHPPSGEDADEDSYDVLIEPEERWGPPTSVGPEMSSTWAVVCRFSSARKHRAEGEAPVAVLAPPTVAPPVQPQHRWRPPTGLAGGPGSGDGRRRGRVVRGAGRSLVSLGGAVGPRRGLGWCVSHRRRSLGGLDAG